MITIVIADDHPIARAGIHNLLSSDPELVIIGEAENGIEAQELVEKLRPNILLLDLKMPGPRPADLERYVRTNFPETITLVLTAHDRDVYLADMVKAGVSGYFSKSVRGETLIKAIHRAVEGEYLITETQKERVKHWEENNSNKRKKLTQREKEILTLMNRGLDDTAISNELGIAYQTTVFHITNIRKKLEVTSRQQATKWANENLGDN
ncbi:DNA-binding transcriptional activator DevR/DosR [Anaerolineales bacterium]|nr:DNA-binding transcriptional activator DevR/DosR [Anaerolineales bacterium]